VADADALLTLPEYPFSVFRYASLTVSKTGFVVIDTNKYGLSPALAGEVVQAKIFFDHIEFFSRPPCCWHLPTQLQAE